MSGVAVSVAQSASVVIIPADIAVPLLVREMSGNRVALPDCNLQVVVANKNNFVCANSAIDWSSYGSVNVTAVDVEAMHLKKPLSDHEIEELKAALTDSLQQEFDGAGKAGAGRTLNLHATVTNVQRTNKALNIVSLIAIQTPLSFGGTSTRIELSDGTDGAVLAEMAVSRRGRTYDVLSSVQSLGHAKKSLNRTSKQAGKDLQMLRSRFTTVATASALPE
jgi:hypothetical protein